MSESRQTLRYWDSTEARVGDTVRVDGEWQAVVTELVDTSEKMKACALDEFGFFVDREGTLFFLPERFLREYPVDLVSRP